MNRILAISTLVQAISLAFCFVFLSGCDSTEDDTTKLPRDVAKDLPPSLRDALKDGETVKTELSQLATKFTKRAAYISEKIASAQAEKREAVVKVMSEDLEKVKQQQARLKKARLELHDSLDVLRTRAVASACELDKSELEHALEDVTRRLKVSREMLAQADVAHKP